MQATSVMIENWHGPLTVSAVYSPPNYPPNKEGFIQLFRSLGSKFLAGGGYNSKHTLWGSRLLPPGIGRTLYQVVQKFELGHYQPTYWPTDPEKLPDSLDFFVTKEIAPGYLKIEQNWGLHSDHSPVVATVSTFILEKEKPSKPANKKVIGTTTERYWTTS